MRIAAELVDTSTSSPIWANRYDRELEDIFAVQDEITEAIVGAIAPEIDEAERRLAQRHPPESLDVWVWYQRALIEYFVSTSVSNKSAIEQLDQINELAPLMRLLLPWPLTSISGASYTSAGTGTRLRSWRRQKPAQQWC